jgi:hypothetical protein
MRYRLRTLLLVLAVLPPLVWIGWTNYRAWQFEQEQLRTRREWLDRFGVLPPPAVFREEGIETGP